MRPPKPNMPEFEQLSIFCKEVEFILQTVNDNEYQAAVIMMGPPSDTFTKSVVFPSAGKVVGLFADHKAALIQTDVGSNSTDYIEDALHTFPNAKYVIGVGVGYAFDRSKYKLGDVMVFQKISDLRNLKFSNGEIINRGETVNVVNTLTSVFCKDLSFDEEFEVSQAQRHSKVYTGRYASYAAVLDNEEMRDKFRAAVPEAIGGEMEGGELLRFQQKRKIEGVIVIKGVVDYGEGVRTKEWQFTATMAALKYTQSKLHYYQGQELMKKSRL